jgi:hypothetical protein
MQENKNINEFELDELLRELSLDENSEIVNETEASFILSQEYPVEIDADKEMEVLNKLWKDTGNSDNSKSWTTIFLIITLIALLLYAFLRDSGISKGNLKIAENAINEVNKKNASKHNILKTTNTTSSIVHVKQNDTFGREKFISMIAYSDSTKYSEPHPPTTEIEIDHYTIPKLLEKDKLLYQKIKEQMLRRIIKSDKGLYTHVPSYKLIYKGVNTILDAFSVRNVCITNLEYKTFLADLLIQKRSSDYLNAQIKTENWIKQDYNSLANVYFQDEKYNDFPVVNVNRKGAELFCDWLQEELKLYVMKNNLKFPDLKIRLPYDNEAIFAAREGYAKISFEEGYNTIYDECEGLVDHTFTKRAQLAKKRVKRMDTLYSVFVTNKYWWKEKEILDFYSQGNKYYRNIPGDSIFSDRMKVLTKIGRVSEMVMQKNSDNTWLSGQTWKTKAEYLKLESEFKLNKSSPFVGFRVVLIDPNDPEYKNPFW